MDLQIGESRSAGRAEARRRQKRAAILAIAREAFFRDGYVGTSMSEIASRVGGSKGTLYSHFRSKAELFRAVLEDFLAAHSEEIESTIEAGGPPREVLRAFSQRFLEVLIRPANLALFRLVYAEAGRFPEVGQAFYESGPQAAEARLVAYLEGAIEAGHLRRDTDPLLAARQLFLLSQGWIYHERMWNVGPPPSREEIERAAETAVATFLAAYGA
jgi:TetR/AcrR family transcriptional regulator, mexJK operon transcriptional repressor